MTGPRVDGDEILLELIDVANASRQRASDDAWPPGSDAQARLDSLFRTDEQLAVYGSLAPGRQNHHIVAPYGGAWTGGFVEGDLHEYGWGTAIGFPALRLRSGGPSVPVHLLTSGNLRAAWAELDEFEGREYRRVLVPVWSANDRDKRILLTVANIYEAALPHDSPLDIRPNG